MSIKNCVFISAYFELEKRTEMEEELGPGEGCMTGPILIALHSVLLDYSQVIQLLIPILQVRKLRHKEVEHFPGLYCWEVGKPEFKPG